MDPITNFAKVTVSAGYSDTDTTIVLQSGDGAKLPDPATDGEFNLVWFNATDYNDPSDDPNVEIIRVTAVSTDTLTITRAQEGTSASTKNTAGKTYLMILALTKKIYDDIKDKLSEITGTDKAVGKTATQTLTNKTLESPTINTPTFSAGAVDTDDIASGAVTLAKTTGIIGADASGKEIRYASAVITTNASGDATVLFSSAFSTDATTVLAVNGDNSAFANGTISIISKATNGFNIHCFNADGSAKASAAVRVNYIAVGY